MKGRPILFSAPMVRAILAGEKTQTRRVVKPQPVELPDFNRGGLSYNVRGSIYRAWNPSVMDPSCPCGQPGDRLWVRENGFERPERTLKQMREGADTWPKFAYDADGWGEQDHADFKAWGFKRRPSIHMPRWASRILLEVTGIRVEQLNDISTEDAYEEGASLWAAENAECLLGEGMKYRNIIEAYKALWESINGAGSWSANPWVWVIEFKRVQP